MGIHGINIGEIHYGCLISQMLQRSINQIEMNTLCQQIGGYHYFVSTDNSRRQHHHRCLFMCC